MNGNGKKYIIKNKFKRIQPFLSGQLELHLFYENINAYQKANTQLPLQIIKILHNKTNERSRFAYQFDKRFKMVMPTVDKDVRK